MYYAGELNKCRDTAFAADRLHELRKELCGQIPPKSNENLLLATWNIREFSSLKRLRESLLYIAEIIDHFDLVAIQEVGTSLTNLNTVCGILGFWWDYIVSDVTEGAKGDNERLAFLYDKRRVRFGGVAGEVVIPPKEKGKHLYQPAEQLYKTPYLVGFKSGWRKFMLCTVHIAYNESTADDPVRLSEIKMVADFLKGRATEKGSYSKAIALIGDFNIFKPSDNTMKMITGAGFKVPPELQKVPGSNVEQNRHYDQIAFLEAEQALGFTGQAGVFDYYKTVFRDSDHTHYGPDMGESYNVDSKGKSRDEAGKLRYYRTSWRTFQMSDHLPMWIQLQTDFADEYLDIRTKG